MSFLESYIHILYLKVIQFEIPLFLSVIRKLLILLNFFMLGNKRFNLILSTRTLNWKRKIIVKFC